MTKANATNKVSSLIRQGYLQKEQSREDRRSFLLIATEKAIDLVEHTYMEYYKTMEKLKEKMGNREFETFVSLLQKANEIWILITRASGNVGRYVAKYALENRQQITVAGTHTGILSEMFGSKVQVAHFDFSDPSTFGPALQDIDRVFIMRPPHLGKQEDLKPFIDAIKEKGGIRLVSFLSLIGVEKNPVPPHHKIEKYILS